MFSFFNFFLICKTKYLPARFDSEVKNKSGKSDQNYHPAIKNLIRLIYYLCRVFLSLKNESEQLDSHFAR